MSGNLSFDPFLAYHEAKYLWTRGRKLNHFLKYCEVVETLATDLFSDNITVRRRYDAVNFMPNPHKIHCTARPLGRDKECNKMKPGYFSLAATVLKPQQIPMLLHISARV